MAKAQNKSPIGIRLLILGLIFILGLLQVRLWLSEDGWSEVLRLRGSAEVQRNENAALVERNNRLRAEVTDLKGGFAALEERARSDLGMVAKDESFYLLVPDEVESPEQGSRR